MFIVECCIAVVVYRHTWAWEMSVVTRFLANGEAK